MCHRFWHVYLDRKNWGKVTQFFLFVCSWSAAGQKDDTTEGADLTLFPHPHPNPLPARQTRHSITLNTAPCCCFGAAKKCLNYKYIYINIPCLYSSNPLHPPTLPLTSWILTTTYVFFSLSLSLTGYINDERTHLKFTKEQDKYSYPQFKDKPNAVLSAALAHDIVRTSKCLALVFCFIVFFHYH